MVYVKMLSDDTETLRCKTSFAFFIPKKHEKIMKLIHLVCPPPPPPPHPAPKIICISIQALSFTSLGTTFNTRLLKLRGYTKLWWFNKVYYGRCAMANVYIFSFAVRPDL